MSVESYGLQDIKKELQHLSSLQMADLCLRLARYKKENKELLAYLLFQAGNETAFVEQVKSESGFMFSQLPAHSYTAAKSMRKILRLLGKYTKFMGSKEAEIELLLNFCSNYINYVDRKASYKPMRLILIRQLQKIQKLIDKLHEDLQADFTNGFNAMIEEAAKKFAWIERNDYLL